MNAIMESQIESTGNVTITCTVWTCQIESTQSLQATHFPSVGRLSAAVLIFVHPIRVVRGITSSAHWKVVVKCNQKSTHCSPLFRADCRPTWPVVLSTYSITVISTIHFIGWSVYSKENLSPVHSDDRSAEKRVCANKRLQFTIRRPTSLV